MISWSSGSAAVRAILAEVSSSIWVVKSLAIGASLVEPVVMVTLASAESAKPSLAMKVKVSEPEKLVFGVYVRFGAMPERVPFCG